MPPCSVVEIQGLLFVGSPSQVVVFVVVSNKSKALGSLVPQCRGAFFIRKQLQPCMVVVRPLLGIVLCVESNPSPPDHRSTYVWL